jgi:hypothetical protein
MQADAGFPVTTSGSRESHVSVCGQESSCYDLAFVTPEEFGVAAWVGFACVITVRET